MKKGLLVLGGTGFVGKAASKYAISQGLKVFSLSRKGKPEKLEDWQKEVTFLKGDALSTGVYKDVIKECDAVIHSVGVLLDSKGLIRKKEKYEGSYEHLNRDTAIAAAKLLEGTGKTFVYISAEKGLVVAPAYLSTKRQVEEYLKNNADKLNYSVIRPGFIYNNAPVMRVIASTINILSSQDSIARSARMEWYATNLVPARSLHVDMIGKVAVLAGFKKEFNHHTLNTREIEEAAKKYESIQ
jgi:nucleoside-diphosphate-sugar epimerase